MTAVRPEFLGRAVEPRTAAVEHPAPEEERPPSPDLSSSHRRRGSKRAKEEEHPVDEFVEELTPQIPGVLKKSGGEGAASPKGKTVSFAEGDPERREYELGPDEKRGVSPVPSRATNLETWLMRQLKTRRDSKMGTALKVMYGAVEDSGVLAKKAEPGTEAHRKLLEQHFLQAVNQFFKIASYEDMALGQKIETFSQIVNGPVTEGLKKQLEEIRAKAGTAGSETRKIPGAARAIRSLVDYLLEEPEESPQDPIF